MDRFSIRDKVGGVAGFPANLPFDVWNNALLQAILDYVDSASRSRGTNLVPVTHEVTNTLVETTIYSEVIAAGTLGTDKTVSRVISGYIDTSEDNQCGILVKVKYGLSSLVIYGISSGDIIAGMDHRPYQIEVSLSGKGDEGEQLLSGKFISDTNLVFLTRLLTFENSEADQTFAVTIQMLDVANDENVFAVEIIN